jgi:hypothetical protein
MLEPMRNLLLSLALLALLQPTALLAQDDGEPAGETSAEGEAAEGEPAEGEADEEPAQDEAEEPAQDEAEEPAQDEDAGATDAEADDATDSEATDAEDPADSKDAEDPADSEDAEEPPPEWTKKWWAKTAGSDQRPGPYLYVRARVGVQFFPLGLVGEVIAMPRFALKRSESVFFNTTFAGVGLYLRGSPAFFEVGPRFVIRPIEIFQVGINGLLIAHWKSVNGRVPFDALANKTYADRQVHPYEGLPAATLYVDVAPTLRLRAGPVLILYGGAIAYQHTFLDVDADQLLYDPALDLLIFKREVTINHQVAVMGEILDGKRTAARLRLGATWRQRVAVRSTDQTMNVGFIGTFKPGRRPGWPDILVSVMPYLRDTDRVGGPPWAAIALTWEVDPSLRKRSSVDSAQAAMESLNGVFGGRSL